MNETANNERAAVLGVFASALRPLVPLAAKYGITAPDIARLLKGVFVQKLEETFLEQGRPAVSDIRLAILAGLTGSEVSALRTGVAPQNANAGVSPERLGHVLSIWTARFAGVYGVPLDLPLRRADDGRASFPDLVAEAFPNGELAADVVLDAFIAAKSVEIVDGQVHCLSQAYVTKKPDANRVEQAGRFVGLAVSTFVHNLLRNEASPSYFERAVLSDVRLNDAGLNAFLAIAKELGEKWLFEIDTRLTQMDASMQSDAGKRYGMGFYIFEDRESDAVATGNLEQRDRRSSSEDVTADPKEIDVLALGKKR